MTKIEFLRELSRTKCPACRQMLREWWARRNDGTVSASDV